MEELSYTDLEAATQGFSPSTLIGKGSHGYVYKGTLLPQPPHQTPNNPIFVAIKKPSLGLQILQDNSKLDNEIQIFYSLNKSPYLVNLVGLSRDSVTQKRILVMDFMPNGSLHDSLHKASSSTPPISWPKRALMALQIARAVQFLHDSNPCIIHRDIKSSNILFDSNWNAKLADFGLAVLLINNDSASSTLSQPAGTIGYIDPCYTTPAKLSTKNDVYSFGVVLLEILSCRKAIDVAMEPASTVEWAVPLIEEDRTDEILDSRVMVPSTAMKAAIRNMLSIAARCVSSNQGSRPSMREVVTQLQNSVLLVDQQVRFPILWRTLNGLFMRRRTRRKAGGRRSEQLLIIRCNCKAEEEEVSGGCSVGNGKVSIREVLAEETH